MIEAELDRIMIRDMVDVQTVVLKEKDGARKFPIWIGTNEAQAISRGVKKQAPARPLTHELLSSVIGRLDGTVERIVISDLVDNTFFAQVVIRHNGEVVTVDSRPSDAIALAMLAEAPIYVEEGVFDQVCKLRTPE
jgi:bifunctional DNase/RNase